MDTMSVQLGICVICPDSGDVAYNGNRKLVSITLLTEITMTIEIKAPEEHALRQLEE
jgi:hypothetical protein